MSRDITILLPNGRRQLIHCTADTSLLQVLEDVCGKQSLQANEYDLKHHNHIMDLSTTVRFSNLPNKACLEMVETVRKREETKITIGLTLEDGERRMADFLPQTSLYDVVLSLAPNELNSLQTPTVLYMRQEVIGIIELKEKSLKHLGLLSGRAILRLLNKSENQMQANVSTVYKAKPQPKQVDNNKSVKASPTNDMEVEDQGGPSNAVAPKKPETKYSTNASNTVQQKLHLLNEEKSKTPGCSKKNIEETQDIEMTTKNDCNVAVPEKSSNSSLNQKLLERRLKIEEEVTFIGVQKAIAYLPPENPEDEPLEDLPDDFYELTIEEVRRLYTDLQQSRLAMENTPLSTKEQREQIEHQRSTHLQNTYKHAVVRIQFPEGIILQAVFQPTDVIQDIFNFIKEHLNSPDRPFQIYTTPLKEALDPKMTLLEANFVPCVHMHFKWLTHDSSGPCLKKEIYLKKTSSDAASILASKYRAPNRQKLDEGNASQSAPSTSKNSKMPKWFKK